MKTNSIHQHRIRLNVSGEIYETYKKTLTKFPSTLLGNFDRINEYYNEKRDEYFFNRNRLCFEAILYFYQSDGILTKPFGVSIDDFVVECLFFDLPACLIEEMQSKEGFLVEAHLQPAKTIRMKAWHFLEEPGTSKPALIYAMFSLLAIIVSVVASCMETIPKLNNPLDITYSNPWVTLELCLNAWFLFELFIRFLFSPNRLNFVKSTMNIVDCIAVVPYFCLILSNSKKTRAVSFLRVLRLARLFRLNRLSKHSKRIKVVGAIIKDSLYDLQILMVCLLMVIVFGASIMYFVEGREVFTSIPESMWWAVQTLTTLGYGDITPLTTFGKLFSACFMAFGAITISLPVLSIVTKFTSYYSTNI